MRIGRIEIRWITNPPVGNKPSTEDYGYALAVDERYPFWLAVHQVIDRAEQSAIMNARRHTGSQNLCIADVGASEGIATVRQDLINAKNAAIKKQQDLNRIRTA